MNKIKLNEHFGMKSSKKVYHRGLKPWVLVPRAKKDSIFQNIRFYDFWNYESYVALRWILMVSTGHMISIFYEAMVKSTFGSEIPAEKHP